MFWLRAPHNPLLWPKPHNVAAQDSEGGEFAAVPVIAPMPRSKATGDGVTRVADPRRQGGSLTYNPTP